MDNDLKENGVVMRLKLREQPCFDTCDNDWGNKKLTGCAYYYKTAKGHHYTNSHGKCILYTGRVTRGSHTQKNTRFDESFHHICYHKGRKQQIIAK